MREDAAMPSLAESCVDLSSACTAMAAGMHGSGGGNLGPLRIAIGIATVGRPTTLLRTLELLRGQSRRADLIVVCAPSRDDVGDLAEVRELGEVRLVFGRRGLPKQRNDIIDALVGMDIVIFLDDDFVPHADYVARTESVFMAHPDVVMTTGRVVADGIQGPGLQFMDALEALEADRGAERSRAGVEPVVNGYGCNMALRLKVATEAGVRFDENLPLYGWLEDVDYGVRISRLGRVVRVFEATGVHLGVKSGRQSGVCLGYSQIANPIYLLAKGTCPPFKACRLMSGNFGANLLRSFRPEPYIDRSGRFRGNLKALFDLVAGRLNPSRILSL